MFKLDMQAIRENAKDALLIANVANAANSANGCVDQLATLAGLAISNDIEPPTDRAQWLEIDREHPRPRVDSNRARRLRPRHNENSSAEP